MRKDKGKLLNFLSLNGVGANDENRMFTYLFGERLPKELEYDTADILCVSDFMWSFLCENVQEMIAHAKGSGMKFCGFCVNACHDIVPAAAESMNICDSKWFWNGKECVEVEKH